MTTQSSPLTKALDVPKPITAKMAKKPTLTRQRQKVLDLLRAHQGALGAYEIAARLTDDSGRPIAPVTAYRALDYLCAKGLAHKLASRNAYMACHQHQHNHAHNHTPHAHHDEPIAFLICTSCAKVSEIDNANLGALLNQLCTAQNFQPSAVSLEISGLCGECKDADHTNATMP